MAKWKCEICGNEFENFHAQGFDNKIYCPLCFFKKENQELKKQLEEYKEQVNKGLYNSCLPYTTGYNKAIKDKEIQQKEFIKFLEQKEEMYDIGANAEMAGAINGILKRYKKIIGGKE